MLASRGDDTKFGPQGSSGWIEHRKRSSFYPQIFADYFILHLRNLRIEIEHLAAARQSH